MHKRLARPLPVLALALLALTGCKRENTAKPAPPPGAPNIVLISVDTLRADHLGCYGYPKPTSPRIDELARDGALFEQMISSTSWTLPAHCALFTGLADSVHGCTDMDRALDPSRVTLAERLKEIGYVTAGFFSGPALHPIFGVAQGFDTYEDCTSYRELTERTLKQGVSIDGGAVRASAHRDIANPHTYAAVQKWLEANHKSTFFAFIHFWDVHIDYIPPPPYDTMFDPNYTGSITGADLKQNPAVNKDMPARDLEHVIALYDGEIAWTDEHVGRVLDDLDRLGLRDNTIVVLLADHGDEHFEHGRKGHRQTLYDEVLHVPLIIRYPDRIRPGSRYGDQVRMIDVLPTLMDLAGLPPPTPAMGRSLTPLFEGGALDGEQPAVSELLLSYATMTATRYPQRKMIYNWRTGGALIFDLASDPGERHELSDEAHPLVKQTIADMVHASKWLERARDALVQAARSGTTAMPADLKAQLETLGYIGGYEEDFDPNQSAEGLVTPLPATAPSVPGQAPASQPAEERENP